MPRKCKKCIAEQRKEMFFPVNDMFYFKTLQHEMVLILIFCCYFIVFKFKISTFNFKTITIMAELLDLEKKRPRDTSGDVMTLTTNEKQKKLIHHNTTCAYGDTRRFVHHDSQITEGTAY